MVIIRKLARYEAGLKSYQFKIKEQSYKYIKGFCFQVFVKERTTPNIPDGHLKTTEVDPKAITILRNASYDALREIVRLDTKYIL